MPSPTKTIKELDDDRDVGQVGQPEDAEERRQDRRDCDEQGQQHGRQRAEHGEQDQQRARATEQRLDQQGFKPPIRPATAGSGHTPSTRSSPPAATFAAMAARVCLIGKAGS